MDVLEEIINEIKADVHITKYILPCDQSSDLTVFSGKAFWYKSCTYDFDTQKYGEADFLRKYKTNTENLNHLKIPLHRFLLLHSCDSSESYYDQQLFLKRWYGFF